MRYGLVVHGAEVIDSGTVTWVLDRLQREAEVVATLGGAMGAAALIDAGLQDRVSVVPRQLVSHALPALEQVCDATVMLNLSKTKESGLGFGSIVYGRVADKLSKPMVQMDHGFYVEWVPPMPLLLHSVVKELGMIKVDRPPREVPSGVKRVLHGVLPGESVWINGTVVGRATSSEVVVILCNGKLELLNVEVKEHGMEKVHVDDLQRAVIRSGSVRRTSSSSFFAAPSVGGEKVILVDHRAEDSIFRARGARAAVTVGDDTTRVASSLLARLGVPVIGIVDGDEDGICQDCAASPGSVTLVLYPGNDDQVGALVRQELFYGSDEMRFGGPLENLLGMIIDLAQDVLLEVKKK
jgi:hypothetical protein